MRIPEPFDDPPEGFEYEPFRDPRWRVPSGYQKCRYGLNSCDRPPVADLNRGAYRHRPPYGRVDRWWAYCSHHLYEWRHWIEDGHVMSYRLRERKEPDS